MKEERIFLDIVDDEDPILQSDFEMAKMLQNEEENVIKEEDFDVYKLFSLYNLKYFKNKLDSCVLEWSKKMKLCAGICYYEKASKLCTIRLSEPILKFREKIDIISTLL